LKSYSIRDSMSNQSHLILPVVLASIALTGIGFAIAALVGTGSDATAADPAQTLTIRSTISGGVTTVSHTVTKRHVIKGKVITKNGQVTTLPAQTLFNTFTTPGQRITSTRTATSVSVHSVTGPTNTVTAISTLTVPTTVTVPTTITVTGPTSIVTTTVTAPAP
jgi:hypothetical protein